VVRPDVSDDKRTTTSQLPLATESLVGTSTHAATDHSGKLDHHSQLRDISKLDYYGNNEESESCGGLRDSGLAVSGE
jgi:hypothetical protein